MMLRSRVGLALPLAAIALLFPHPPSAFASGDPRDSFLYQNFVLASEVLDRAVAAHGGAELIDRGLDVRFSFTGTYRDENHLALPWAHNDYRLDGTTF